MSNRSLIFSQEQLEKILLWEVNSIPNGKFKLLNILNKLFKQIFWFKNFIKLIKYKLILYCFN